MELIQDQEAAQSERIKKQIDYLAEILQKSEKYERLMQSDDFKGLLNDFFEEAIKQHEIEIKVALEDLSQASVAKQKELQNLIFIHQLKKEVLEILMNRPKEIVELAKKARNDIPELQAKLKKLEGSHAA